MQSSTDMIRDSAAEFVPLLREHERLVYRVAGTYAQRRADVEDLVQEITAQAWRSFRSYDAQRRFSTWLYRVALNVAISWLRVEAPRRRLSVPYEVELHDSSVTDDIDTDEGGRILRGFIDTVGPLDRAVLLLYLEERPLAEISEILGLTTTNLTTKIGRLKDRLRTYAESKHGTR